MSFQDEAETVAVPHLSLFIRGPGLPGVSKLEISTFICFCQVDISQGTIFSLSLLILSI